MNETTMNYNEQQPPQLTIPPPIYTQTHPPHYQNQPHYHHQYPQQPNPTSTIPPSINHQPPPLQSYDSYSLTYTTQPTQYVTSYDVGNNGFTSYYHDPNWVSSFGVTPLPYSTPNNNIAPPNGAQQYVAPNYDLSRVTNPAHLHRLSKKHSKTPNVSLSVRCDVCKILCDTHDVLEKHRLGKKHKKNLEKLKATVAGGPTGAPNGGVNPVTSVLETPDTSKSGNGQTGKKKAANSEDLERKRRRVLDGGTAVDSVRMCTTCNVVCNSETVFQAHLAGKMHKSMLKKQARGKLPDSSAAKLS